MTISQHRRPQTQIARELAIIQSAASPNPSQTPGTPIPPEPADVIRRVADAGFRTIGRLGQARANRPG